MVHSFVVRDLIQTRIILGPNDFGANNLGLQFVKYKHARSTVCFLKFTFSNNDGNFEGELTNARNPSKSSLTVLGDKMSECASMINVRPRFLPKFED